LFLELLDYINHRITKGGVSGLIEKVESAVKSENVKVEFRRIEEVYEIIKERNTRILEK